MSHFFAYMARMRYIRRWGLMRSTHEENIQEHSLQVAMIAHALALIGNRLFDRHYDAEHIMALAAFHEAGEVITGDLPTPIKYATPELREAYKRIETLAEGQLLEMIPGELREDYAPLLTQAEDESHRLVKAADRIAAYLKCVEELKSGNHEFYDASRSIQEDIDRLNLPEAAWFMETFAPSFSMTLDEMKR